MAINKSTVIARLAFVAAAVLVAAILTSHIAHAGAENIGQCGHDQSDNTVKTPQRDLL